MSGSNNLPIKVSLDGVADVNRQIRELAESFTAPVRAAERLPVAVGRASEAFGQMEGRAQAGRRALNDLRGALDLLGGSGAGGSVGAVASYIGNIADLFGTASLASGRLEAAAGLLSSRMVALAGIAALPIFLQQVGLGINSAGQAADSASGTTDAWRATIERLNPVLAENARLATEAAEAAKRLRDQQAGLEEGFGRVLVRRAQIIDELGPSGGLTRQIATAEAGVVAASAAVAREQERPLTDDRRAFLQNQQREAEAALRTLQARRTDLNAELARLSSNDGPSAPGEPGSPNYEFTVIGQRLSNTDPRNGGPQFGPDPPSVSRGGGGGGAARADPALTEAQRLFDTTRTAAERYTATLERLGELRPQLEQMFGDQGANEIIARSADKALQDLERAEQAGARMKNLGEQTRQASDAARELGLAFSSAFEDAVINGKPLRDMIRGLEQDLLRVGTRRLVTEPLVNAASGLLSGGQGGSGGSFDWMKLIGTVGGIVAGAYGGGMKGPESAGTFTGTVSGMSGSTRIFHGGGIVGQGGFSRVMPSWGWDGVPRYHGGGMAGLASDEYRAVLRRNEEVLTEENPRHVFNAGRGGSSVVMNIYARDANSFRASQGQLQRDMNRGISRGQRNA